ncbi:MAG: hypothetical protein Q4A55_03180 [Aerococcus sp.]|nr:hypothetical protein [Aerococcus sp.]
MQRVTVQQMGEEWMLPIPNDLSVLEGQEYTIERKSDGTLIYTPVHQNPFEGHWVKADLKQTAWLKREDLLESEWSK